MNKEGKTEIREYLLGRVTDNAKLEGIEERLFSDDAFCSQVEVVEEELVHDFVFGKLSGEDRKAFEEKIADNSELKFKTEMAQALKEKAHEERPAKAAAPGFLASLKAFFRQPAYVGAFAVFVIGILAFTYFLLPGGRDNPPLAELKNIYRNERVIEPRISDFDYAQLAATRGEPAEADKNKLLEIRLKLVQAVVNSPTAENYYELGIFHLTQQEFADAVEKLGKAVELDDKIARYHNDLGNAYFELAERGKKDKNFEGLVRANEEYAKAFELDPKRLDALFNQSLTLQKLKLPQRAKESWRSYLQKDSSSKWADEARKYLTQLENQPVSDKKNSEILQDFLNAYRGKNEKMAWKIHTETKGLFTTDLSLAKQLPRLYLDARQQHDEGQAREALDALIYIDELEKKNANDDMFFAELASYYGKVEDAKIDQLIQAKALSTEGHKLNRDGKGDQAVKQYEKSKEIFLRMNSGSEVYQAELELISILPYISRIDESLPRFDALIGSADKLKFKVLLPAAYYYKSVAEFRRNQYSQAIKTGRKSLQLAEELTDVYGVQHEAEALAELHEILGEPEVSLNYLGKAMGNNDLYYVNPGNICRSLLTSSNLSAKLELNRSAADFARESLELSQKVANSTDLVNDSMKNLTRALASNKQFDKALEIADESNRIALSRGPGEENDKTIADTFLSRADLKGLDMQNCGEALPDYERSLEYYGKVPEATFNLYRVHKGKLFCFHTLKLQNEFENELDTVIQISEENRRNIREDALRQAFFENEQVVFDTAIANALQQNASRTAFERLETSKARSLLDFIKSEKSILEAEKEFGSVTKSLTLQEIQARLPENVQVIQYAVLPEKLAIWTLTKDRFEFSEKKITDGELKKKVSDYNAAILAKAGPETLKPRARELYDLLLPPNIESGKPICLIPDKFLHQLYFASLVSPANKVLIEDFPVFYSPSASILVLASENARQKETVTGEHLLGIGNPSFDREENPKLAALPQAETEIKAIAKGYPGAREFTGDKATRESFLSNIEGAEVIHFAGHFVANERAPGYSKLLFAGGDLRSFELAEKRLPKAKLVVLSACQTGFEGYNRSEGAIGIARAFLATGVPLVLASGWQVDSEATRDLMIAFHRNRKEKGMNSSESLRRAQLDLLKNEKTSAPYYWSAFGAVGGATNY